MRVAVGVVVSCLLGRQVALAEEAPAPAPRARRSRIRAECAPEFLSLDPEQESAINFARHSQTLCNTSSPWAEKNANVREVLGFVAPWNDHGYKAARFIRRKLSSVSPLWFRIMPGRDAEASAAYEINGLNLVDEPEQKRWRQQIDSATHLDLLPHFSLEGFNKLESIKAILEKPMELAAEIAVICEHSSFSGIVFDLRAVLFRTLKPFIPRLVQALSQALRSSNRRLLLSVPAAPVPGGGGSASRDFDGADAALVAKHVDAVIVGTRDFSLGAFGPMAPLPWVRVSVTRLMDKAAAARGSCPGSSAAGEARAGAAGA